MRSDARFVLFGILLISLLSATPAPGQSPEEADEGLSLDDLLSTRVSTASLYSQYAREAPASVSIVSAAEIERFQFRTLGDLLGYVRSFYLSNDRNYTYGGVRGFGRPGDFTNRMLVLWNGHVLNDNVYASSPVGFDFMQDLRSIERVEIVRGPGSPLYGANAMLAVINIISRTGADVGGAEATVEYGSNGFAQGSLLLGTTSRSGFDATLSGTWLDHRGPDLYYPEFDTPETDHGVVRHLDWEQGYGLNGRVTLGGLQVQGIFSSRSKGIPTASYGTVFGDGRAMTRDERWALSLGYTLEPSVTFRLSGRVALDSYEYYGTYPYEELQSDGSGGRWGTARIHAQWDVHASNRLDMGAEVRSNWRADYRVWSLGYYDYSHDDPYTVSSLFLQDTYQAWPGVSLSAAVRIDRHSVIGWLVSPRFAVVADPFPGSTLKVLYGEAFRPPSVYELFYEEEGNMRSNPSLGPERVRTLELCADQRFSPTTAGSFSVYQYTMRDIVEQIPVDDQGTLQHRNSGVARGRGIEGEVVFRSPAGFTASASAGAQYIEAMDGSGELTNAPRTIVCLNAGVPLGASFMLALQGRFETGRLTTQGTRTDRHLLVNAFVHGWMLFDAADVSVAIRNLLGARYALPGGYEHAQAAIGQDGRTFALRVRLHL